MTPGRRGGAEKGRAQRTGVGGTTPAEPAQVAPADAGPEPAAGAVESAETGSFTLAESLSSFFEPEFLGFRVDGGLLRFAIHARAARAVELRIYEPGAGAPARTVDLDPDPLAPAPWMLWTAELDGLPERFEYTVRVDGGAELLDPYARLLAGGEVWGRSGDALAPGVGRRYRSLFLEQGFDWEEVERPRVERGRRVVYELHVRGFTRHPTAGVARPGSYLGLIEKIPYLQELGVTTVELLPIQEFDETENPRRDPLTGARLLNFWGYSPVAWFAPKAGYADDPAPGSAGRELKELVRELHRAGIEVVLDVVYNHTAESVQSGAVHSLRGLDAGAYYLHDGDGTSQLDYTGCGNTVHVNHPVTRRLILDSLRHWCDEYRIDGFRFDLAGVFYRGAGGETLARSALVEEITADPTLGSRFLSAEPWDATGFTPENGFPEPWLEWDGELRDALRRHVGGLDGDPRALARRMAGVGAESGRVPAERSVRFVACHDGRPLADVVAYAWKDNLANGEENRDGWNGEVAWNGGVEGETDDAAVLFARGRQIRSLVALLAATPGTLLLAAGDERARTQRGNNNAWCQDNEVGWVDWTPTEEGEALHFLVRRLLALRGERLLGPSQRRSALIEPYRPAPELAGDPAPGFLLVHAAGPGEPAWILAANPDDQAVQFPLPAAVQGRRWRLRLDTARTPGQEVFSGEQAPFLAYETTHLALSPRSVRIVTAEELDVTVRGEADRGRAPATR
jgi:glycogen operon protein